MRATSSKKNKTRRPLELSRSEVAQWIVENSKFERSQYVHSLCLIAQGSVSNCGYVKVKWHGKTLSAHRLILEEELGRKLSRWEFANHKCHNRRCVNVEHLYLGNPASNSEHMVEVNRQAKGECHGRSKLTEKNIIEIRRRYNEEGHSPQKISEDFPVCRRSIARIVKYDKWTHVA